MDVEEICSGWLTKSPSSKYVTLFSRGKISIRVPLKSKWHRRYFVLHKPHGSLPHQYAFDYFKDKDDRHRRGTINLEECETILAGLDSSHYSHLFSIKTKARDKDRVYYLAADSDTDMTKWVDCLCSLCDLKIGPTDVVSEENHLIAPNPPVRHDSMQLTVDLPTQKTSSNQSLVDEELSNQILQEIEAIEQGRLEIDSRPTNDRVPMGYTELAECTTGESAAAAGPQNTEEFIELYDVPKSQRLAPPTRYGLSQSVRRPTKSTTEGIMSSRSANSSPRFARTLGARPDMSEPVAPPRPPKPAQVVEDLYQNVSNNSPLLVRSGQGSPSLTRLNNNNSINDKFIYPNSNSLSAYNSLSASNSAHNSPAVDRKTEGRASPARNYSVDSLYHNTAILSPPINGANGELTSQQQQDSLYDIPKSCNISVAIPAPAQCGSATSQQTIVHKYVNASAGIISRPPKNASQDSREIDASSKQSESPTEREIELTRQHTDENFYGLSPGSLADVRPSRPPKPRILSDHATLDASEDDAFREGHHSVLKVSKSFRTRAFTKDSVFSDSEESAHTYNSEEIKLPSRINTNDSSSSSNEVDSSSEEEDERGGGGRVESIYDVPAAPRVVQPELPKRLHNMPTAHTHTMDNRQTSEDSLPFNVKRSSSMSKVPLPHGSSLSKLSTVGGMSPKLINNQHSLLRSERSSSVSATDWRSRPININSMGLSQIMPKPTLRMPTEPVINDIQYVELDQSDEKAEPSPKTTRSSLSSMIPAGGGMGKPSELEYTDIDLVKTQALTFTRQERDLNMRKRSENME